jgi:hypothetical protein
MTEVMTDLAALQVEYRQLVRDMKQKSVDCDALRVTYSKAQEEIDQLFKARYELSRRIIDALEQSS